MRSALLLLSLLALGCHCHKRALQGNYCDAVAAKHAPVAPVDDPVLQFAPETSQVITTIYFDFDNSDLLPYSIKLLDEIVKIKLVSVSIEGHCDERGSDAYNLALGDKRARAAGGYLGAHGVSLEKINTQSYGKSALVARDCRDDVCHAQNRRGVIKLVVDN